MPHESDSPESPSITDGHTIFDVSDRGIRDWWEARQSAIRTDHTRFVPTADLVIDRWHRAKFYGFGSGASIYDSALVIGDVTVGESTWIGPWTVLDGSGGLTIGSFCSISAGAQIYSHNSVAWATSGGKVDVQRAATRIGDHTYIGPSAVIEAGSDIGVGCVVGALSLVRGCVPSGYRAYGSPAQLFETATEE